MRRELKSDQCADTFFLQWSENPVVKIVHAEEKVFFLQNQKEKKGTR